MFRIYSCITTNHDFATLLLSLLICGFGATISLHIGRRALTLQGAPRRRRLLIAGLSTGLTIWSTHFSAMLAYTPGVEIRFNAPVALGSASLAVLMSVCGWLILSAPGRWRGLISGAFTGLALCTAHFVDMSSLRVNGLVFYDAALIAGSIAVGFPLCVASGVLLRRRAPRAGAWASGCLILGIIGLHLIAMSSVTIVPTAASGFSPLDFGIAELAMLVIASSALILILGVALTLHDLELTRATAADRELLRRSEEHYRFSVELNPQIPWLADAEGRVLEISPRWGVVVGDAIESAIGFGWTDKVHPEDLGRIEALWRKAIATGGEEEPDARYRLRRADGSYRWFRARARPRRDEAGNVMLWYGSLEDIHDQVNAELALRASEERYRLAALATNDVIWDFRPDSERIEWNGAVEHVLGYPEAKSGTTRDWWTERLHPEDREPFLAKLSEIGGSGTNAWTQEFRFRTGGGQYVHLLSRGYVLRDACGEPVRMVGSLMDITARKRGEDELRWAAHHDPLTRLPNRKLFSIELDAALRQAGRDRTSVGLIVIDLDGFKTLNDTLGHAAGDTALVEVARRLEAAVPAGATVARLGGDEFAIILPRTAADTSVNLSKSLLAGADTAIAYDGRVIDISLSLGAAFFPEDGGDSESLLKSADLALYAAKAEGAGRAQCFRPSMREVAENDKKMRSNAREALRREDIVPFYQPKICLLTGDVVGFEALLRWHDGELGIQTPASIRSAFDDPRLAPELTDRMLGRITADMAEWLHQGYTFGRIAMNATPEDFRRGDLADRILGSLAALEVEPALFELEITESVFLDKRAEEVEGSLHALRRESVTIGLDDFGTGYASLTHLKQFPVDVLKIDQSFVSRLACEARQDTAIVGALIDLAENLGIQTVAEGVETPLQALLLRDRGCHVGQGYFFARPLSSGQIPRFLRDWQPHSLWTGLRLAHQC